MEHLVITVRAGEMFKVEFRATPATGYQWHVAGLPPGIELVEDRFTADSGPGPALVPVSGNHVFHFLTWVPGSVALHFVLKRSWETDAVDERTEEVLVLP